MADSSASSDSPREIDSLEDARQHPNAVLVLEGEDDDACYVRYVQCPLRLVRCELQILQQLLADLHSLFGSYEYTRLFCEVQPSHPANEPRGESEEGILVDHEIRRIGLEPAIQDVLAGRVGSLFEGRVIADAVDRQGKTGLHRAAQEGILAMVRQFIAGGADVSAKDPEGRTPLHYAARGDRYGCTREHEAIVAALIAAGAHVNARDHDCMFPIHHAALSGKEAILAALAAAGADLNSHRGTWHILDLVRKHVPEPDRIVAILKAAGAMERQNPKD